MGQDGECALKRTVSWDSQQEGAQTGLPLGRHIKCMEQFWVLLLIYYYYFLTLSSIPEGGKN